MEERERNEVLRRARMESIGEVLEVEVVIDTHFNKFSVTKYSLFLKRVFASQNAIDTSLFKKTWRSLNCSPKTIKVMREIQENLLCVGKRKELITKKRRKRSASAAERGRS